MKHTAPARGVRTVENQDFLLIGSWGAARGSEMPANEENVSNGDETPGGAVQDGSQPAEEATDNVDGTETRRIDVQGPVVVAEWRVSTRRCSPPLTKDLSKTTTVHEQSISDWLIGQFIRGIMAPDNT